MEKDPLIELLGRLGIDFSTVKGVEWSRRSDGQIFSLTFVLEPGEWQGPPPFAATADGRSHDRPRERARSAPQRRRRRARKARGE